MMVTVRDVTQYLEHLAPATLAESWDNVGLLLGDFDQPVQRVMTCLTLTDETADEAREREAHLVITHHPLPFRPIAQVTTQTIPGRLVWKLASGHVSVFSAHTAFDSAAQGINHRLADGLALTDVRPLRPAGDEANAEVGGGRVGLCNPPQPLRELARRLKTFLQLEHLGVVGQLDEPVSRVAIACGAADEFLSDAVEQECDAFVLGEARFHTLLHAQAQNVGLLLPGHFASERFAMERLASELALVFPQLEIWCAERERDPLSLV